MGNNTSKISPKMEIKYCDVCSSSQNQHTPIMKVYHCGKLNGKYLCRKCLIDKTQRYTK